MRNGKYVGPYVRTEPVEAVERALRPPVTPNGNPDVPPSSVGEDVDEPGDGEGFEVVGDAGPWRHTRIVPSPWSGWPGDWATPAWNGRERLASLSDTAYAAVDLNSRVLSTMPMYRTAVGEGVQPPARWMVNPDPDLYSSVHEFMKQLFRDFQHGEAFVLPTAWSDSGPERFHVVPPWLVNVEMMGGRRKYNIGSLDVSDEILHIRYDSSTDDARGHGPLEAGAPRIVAACALAKYASTLAQSGGVPYFVLTHDRALTAKQADDLLHNWWESRVQHLGLPAILSGGLKIESMQISPKDMALIDFAQYTDSRIAVLLGTPPHLLGLPSGGDSMTYSTTEGAYEFHWRAGIKTEAVPVMAALSQWALPEGETVELNRDEYVQPGFGERVTAWKTLHEIVDGSGRVIDAAGIASAERLSSTAAPSILTGGI